MLSGVGSGWRGNKSICGTGIVALFERVYPSCGGVISIECIERLYRAYMEEF